METKKINRKVTMMLVSVLCIIVAIWILGSRALTIVHDENKKLNSEIFPILVNLEKLEKSYTRAMSEAISFALITAEKKHIQTHTQDDDDEDSDTDDEDSEEQEAMEAGSEFNHFLSKLTFQLGAENQHIQKLKELKNELDTSIKKLIHNTRSSIHGKANLVIKEQLEDVEEKIDGEIASLLVEQKNVLHQSNLKITKLRKRFGLFQGIALIISIAIILMIFRSFKALIHKIVKQNDQIINSAKLAAVGEMAAGIAHEINNPLTIISSKVQFLLIARESNKLDDQSYRENMQAILDTVDRIVKITTGLRTISYRGTEDIDEKVSLLEILNYVLPICEERIKKSGVVLKMNVTPESKKTKLECNKIQLSQVIINLLNNALDALKKQDGIEKWVAIESYLENEFLIIKILNSGEKISPEIEEKLFQPFFTTKEVGKGTGLGLSISRGIVERHGGEIVLDQSSDHTCFKMRFLLRDQYE